jgi:cell division protein FtsL
LSLEEASLKDLSRIDRMAREMGMQRPVDGQWESMDATTTEPAMPVMARAGGIMVVSGVQ